MEVIRKSIRSLGHENIDSRLPTKILGEVVVEMKNGEASSKTSLFAGGHALTMTELVVDGRWVAGVLTGKYSIQKGIEWVREAESCMPAMRGFFLDIEQEPTVDSLMLTKAISAIAVADIVATRKAGGPEWSLTMSKGIIGAANLFSSFSQRGFKDLRKVIKVVFPMVFERARALRKARRLGHLSNDWEFFLSELRGIANPKSSQSGSRQVAVKDVSRTVSKSAEPKQSVVSTEPVVATGLNIKALAIGALILCLFPPVRQYRGITFGFLFAEESIALGHLVALIGAWTALVYLWPGTLNPIWQRVRGSLTKTSKENDLSFTSKVSARPEPAKSKPPSDAVRAWIRAGGLIGPVGVETKVPLSTGSREQCEQAIKDAIAEFDQLHPGRRVDEPLDIEYVAPSNGALATDKATITVSINLKFRDVTDYKESPSTKDFFDVFQKHGLSKGCN